MIVGGVTLAGIFSLNSQTVMSVEPSTYTTEDPSKRGFRQFSDVEIRTIYGAFTAVTLCANLVFACAPAREIKDCIGKRKGSVRVLQERFARKCIRSRRIFIDKRMVTLLPLFIHLGFYTAFWMSVYSTSLVFTKSLSAHIYLPAFFSMAVGTGEVSRIGWCSPDGR
ncbi:hypothetical protein COOONC_21680 [Cooperia oncophora]